MANKKKLTEEQEKEIKLLQANNVMYEKTLEEAKLRGNGRAIDSIKIAQDDIKRKMESIMDGTLENFEIPPVEDVKPIEAQEINKSTDNRLPEELFGNNNNFEEESIYDVLEAHKNEEEKRKLEKHSRQSKSETETEKVEFGKEVVNPTNTTFNNVDSTAQYDVISLPSNGECYKSKIGRVPVAYLTAYDENIITSPNLYRDGIVIDYLLKNKIVNKDINVENLVSGDVDAIVLFLRATSYGSDFPVTVEDPTTGEIIETSVDLSTIKTKEFKLKGDENGHFTFVLPKTGVEVKFKYLTRKEENDLKILSRIESEGMSAVDLRTANTTITNILNSDDVLDGREKTIILEATRRIEDWANKIEAKNTNKYNKAITNRLEMQVVAVNGHYERDYVRQAIYNMPASESLALRRFIIENEPGLNFEVEIQRPESLGGGSFKTFLEWNDTVFFNIA